MLLAVAATTPWLLFQLSKAGCHRHGMNVTANGCQQPQSLTRSKVVGLNALSDQPYPRRSYQHARLPAAAKPSAIPADTTSMTQQHPCGWACQAIHDPWQVTAQSTGMACCWQPQAKPGASDGDGLGQCGESSLVHNSILRLAATVVATGREQLGTGCTEPVLVTSRAAAVQQTSDGHTHLPWKCLVRPLLPPG
jgi:hypothetical protein